MVITMNEHIMTLEFNLSILNKYPSIENIFIEAWQKYIGRDMDRIPNWTIKGSRSSLQNWNCKCSPLNFLSRTCWI